LAVQEDAGFFVALDPTVTAELKLEGFARELISRVQRMRKESGFAVSDRIALTVAGPTEVEDVVKVHGAWIAEEVLAAELAFRGSAEQGSDMHAIDLDGLPAFVAITRIE
jgi:isoleucyl-tRNA synthetase